jgi:hypothetical protein
VSVHLRNYHFAVCIGSWYIEEYSGEWLIYSISLILFHEDQWPVQFTFSQILEDLTFPKVIFTHDGTPTTLYISLITVPLSATIVTRHLNRYVLTAYELMQILSKNSPESPFRRWHGIGKRVQCLHEFLSRHGDHVHCMYECLTFLHLRVRHEVESINQNSYSL